MILSKADYANVNLKNKIVVFPTDTVYGIGCLYDDLKSIKRIYDIKNRDYSKPMVILCASLEQVKLFVKNAQDLEKDYIKHWPGKLTIIFFKSEKVYDIISAGKNTVGIRIPGDELSLNLLKEHGPMVVTSLNRSNEPPVTRFEDALKFEAVVDYIFAGKDLLSMPSTVYDATTDTVLRQGEIIIAKQNR